MQSLKEMSQDILCSIAIIPCDLEELIERDFLKKLGGVDQHFAWSLLNMHSKYWYEDKNGVFHIHKKYRDDVKEHVFN